MQKSLYLILLCLASLFPSSSCKTQVNNSEPFRFVASIPLTGVTGRIDHLSYDSQHERVIVAALSNNTVEVVDLNTRKVVQTIAGLHEPQDVIYFSRPGSAGYVLVTNGGDGACNIFNAETFEMVAAVQLDGDADNARYDSAGKKLYVGYGDGGLAVIDAMDFHLLSRVKLSAHPESFQLDKTAGKIYVNVPGKKEVEVIDMATNNVIAQWKLAESSNFPMCLDEINHRLFVGCRSTPKLLILDTQTGRQISLLEIDNDVDDVFYDEQTKDIYLSCGVGTVMAFEQTESGMYVLKEKINTRKGARTSLFIRERNQLIVAAPAHDGNEAALLIYQLN